jgi:hypothetical protein
MLPKLLKPFHQILEDLKKNELRTDYSKLLHQLKYFLTVRKEPAGINSLHGIN